MQVFFRYQGALTLEVTMKRGKALNRTLDFYLGIPLLNLLASVRRSGKYPANPHRIGLLFNPALGDTLLASAAVQDIRALFPKATLVLFAAKSNVSAAMLLPAIDLIEDLPITRPLKSIGILRKSQLDLMLDFTAWQRLTAMYSLLSGARYTVGFERKLQHRHRGYDRTVPHLGDCHELENIRRLTRCLGSQTAHEPRLAVPGGPLPPSVLEGRRIVVFHAWASGSQCWQREWPVESWAHLAQRLMVPGRLFLLTGSPSDEDRCDELRQMLVAQGTPAEVLVGRDGLGEIARVLSHAELLVSVNTGIMHLGAILGVPTVSINGPTAAHRWGAVGPRVANVCPADGSGGYLDLGFEFRGHLRHTMEKVLVEDVLRAIQSLCGVQNDGGFATKYPERIAACSRDSEGPVFPAHKMLLKSGTGA
jgi:heptosyltransferase-3